MDEREPKQDTITGLGAGERGAPQQPQAPAANKQKPSPPSKRKSPKRVTSQQLKTYFWHHIRSLWVYVLVGTSGYGAFGFVHFFDEPLAILCFGILCSFLLSASLVLLATMEVREIAVLLGWSEPVCWAVVMFVFLAVLTVVAAKWILESYVLQKSKLGRL